MKKKIIIIISVIILLIFSGLSIYLIIKKKNAVVYTITNDSLSFQNDYNSLNNTEEYIITDIKSYSPIVYTTYNDIFNMFNNKESGLILLASPTCNLSRSFVEILINSALNNKYKDIKYIDITNDRNTLTLTKKGKIKEKQKSNENYDRLMEYLKDYLHIYEGLNDDSIKRIYMPAAIFIENGKIINYVESLDSYLDRVNGDGNKPMNDIEKIELDTIFNEIFSKLK